MQTLVGGPCVVALVAIFAVLSGDSIDGTTARVLGIALTLVLYSLLGLAGNRLRASAEPWAWLGTLAMALCVAGALTACALWLGLDGDSSEEALARMAGVFAIFAIATSHGSLLIHRIDQRSEAGAAVRYATFACGLIVAAIISSDLVDDSGANDERVENKFFAVVTILWVLGTVVSPLLRLAEPRDQPSD